MNSDGLFATATTGSCASPALSECSSRHDTQGAADQRAAEILRNVGGGERVTQGRDGKIRSKDTIAPAHDPFPPRDREH